MSDDQNEEQDLPESQPADERPTGAEPPGSMSDHDDDEPAAVSIDQVLSVPEDKLDEFFDLEPDEPPESVRGVLVEEAPGSLAALMEEIGCDPAPSSEGSWVEAEPDSEPVRLVNTWPAPSPDPAPLPTPRPAAGRAPDEEPQSESEGVPRSRRSRPSHRGPKSRRGGRARGPASERSPKSKRGGGLPSAKEPAGKGRVVRPPRRKRDAAIPTPPPPSAIDEDRSALAALARTSLYPAALPTDPVPDLSAEPDRDEHADEDAPRKTDASRGATTVSNELTGGIPPAVAAALAQAEAAQRRLRVMLVLALLAAVGIGAFAFGRLSADPRDSTRDERPSGLSAAPSEPSGTATAPSGAGGGPAPSGEGGSPGWTDAGAPLHSGETLFGMGGPPRDGGATLPVADASATPDEAATSKADAGTAPPDAGATTGPTATAEFDRQAAASALARAASAASACRSGATGGTVPVTVSVTFAPSGRVTTANIVGGAFAGTTTGSCIAQAFRSASVPAFSGGPVSVQKTVMVR